MPATGIETAIRELERDAERIQEAIRILRSVSTKTSSGGAAPKKARRGGRRKLSAAGRRRIAEAAKKRWAAFRAGNK